MSGRRVVADDHVASAEHFLRLLGERGGVSGVVHVGAHIGEEVEAYLAAGCRRIVLVEANPLHCAEARRRHAGRSEVEVLHYAVSDRSGTAEMLLHTSRGGSTQAASLLALARFQEIGTLHTAGRITVPAITLDELYARDRLDPGALDLLTLDVQGAELRALQGGGSVLARVRAVLAEVSLVELYAGGACEREVERALAVHGLHRVDALYYELRDVRDRRWVAWGDVLFMRGGGT